MANGAGTAPWISPPSPATTTPPSGASSNTALIFVGEAIAVGVAIYFVIRFANFAVSEWRRRYTLTLGPDDPPMLGLDPADIAEFPTFTYRVAAASNGQGNGGDGKGGVGGVGCSVCLSDLKEGDVVRMLPVCKHFFHAQCVDMWLCSHPSCPVCRSHPEPEKLAFGEASGSPPLPQLLLRCGTSPERQGMSPPLSQLWRSCGHASPVWGECGPSGTKDAWSRTRSRVGSPHSVKGLSGGESERMARSPALTQQHRSCGASPVWGEGGAPSGTTDGGWRSQTQSRVGSPFLSKALGGEESGRRAEAAGIQEKSPDHPRS